MKQLALLKDISVFPISHLHDIVHNFNKKKSVIFKCYSSKKLIALNTLHEVIPNWYSFYS